MIRQSRCHVVFLLVQIQCSECECLFAGTTNKGPLDCFFKKVQVFLSHIAHIRNQMDVLFLVCLPFIIVKKKKNESFLGVPRGSGVSAHNHRMNLYASRGVCE